MTASTLEDKPVTGRRVEYRVHRSVNDDRADVYVPGIVTKTQTAVNGTLLARVRLDGERSSLALPADYDGLRYLDQIVDVPELPMGRFEPGPQHPGFDYAYDGVLIVEFEEGDMAAVTANRSKAEAAVATYLREVHGIDDESDISEQLADLIEGWKVFEWEPEDAECAWLMNPASEVDDHAVHVYYLPV